MALRVVRDVGLFERVESRRQFRHALLIDRVAERDEGAQCKQLVTPRRIRPLQLLLVEERGRGILLRSQAGEHATCRLHDVREFVREQRPSGVAEGRYSPGAKPDVRANGHRPRAQGVRRLREVVVDVDADLREVVVEAPFEVGTKAWLQGPSRRR